MGKFTTFHREIEPTMLDVGFRWSGDVSVQVSDNNPYGAGAGAPIILVVEDGFNSASVSLTLDELTTLRNVLNEAIVWAEGVLSQ